MQHHHPPPTAPTLTPCDMPRLLTALQWFEDFHTGGQIDRVPIFLSLVRRPNHLEPGPYLEMAEYNQETLNLFAHYIWLFKAPGGVTRPASLAARKP